MFTKNNIMLAFLLVFLGFLETGCEREDPDAWRNRNDWAGAYLMMEDFVKERLKSPSTAEFPGVSDGMKDHVKSLGNQRYQIVSYVEAQNSFGAMIKTTFIGEIQQVEKDKWQLISLELME